MLSSYAWPGWSRMPSDRQMPSTTNGSHRPFGVVTMDCTLELKPLEAIGYSARITGFRTESSISAITLVRGGPAVGDWLETGANSLCGQRLDSTRWCLPKSRKGAETAGGRRLACAARIAATAGEREGACARLVPRRRLASLGTVRHQRPNDNSPPGRFDVAWSPLPHPP